MTATVAAYLPGRLGPAKSAAGPWRAPLHAPGTATSPTTPALTIKHLPRPVTAVFRPTPEYARASAEALARH